MKGSGGRDRRRGSVRQPYRGDDPVLDIAVDRRGRQDRDRHERFVFVPPVIVEQQERRCNGNNSDTSEHSQTLGLHKGIDRHGSVRTKYGRQYVQHVVPVKKAPARSGRGCLCIRGADRLRLHPRPRLWAG